MESDLVKADIKPELRLVLVQAPDELPTFSPEYQKELRKFIDGAQAADLRIHTTRGVNDALSGGGGLLGQFVVVVTAAGFLAKKLEGPIKEFLKGNSARKIRAEFREDGTLKTIEARNADEAEQIINAAAKYQKKITHE